MSFSATAQGLRLHHLQVENFMRVEAFSVDPEGNHVIISGENEAGKTSVLNAIFAALQGASSKTIPEPVRHGAPAGSVTLDLGDYIIVRHWTAKSTRLVVTARDGSRVTKPQQLLDGLLGRYALDPVAFLHRRPQDQVDDVLGLAGVEPPVARVAEITGERHEPLPGESADRYLHRLSADEVGLYYLRRREAHRVLDRKKAAIAEHRQAVLSAGPTEAPPSSTELINRIQELQAQNERRAALRAQADADKRDWAAKAAKLNELVDAKKRQDNAVVDLDRRIKALLEEKARAEEQVAVLEGRIENGRNIVLELQRDAERSANAVASVPDPAAELEATKRQLADSERAAKAFASRQASIDLLKRLAEEEDEATREHERLDKMLSLLRHARLHLLDDCDLGVPGLTVDDGELRLKGVPFRQASQAMQMRVACAVCMRQRPLLRLIRVDEAERIDSKGMKVLLEMADKHDWQVICARVADNSKLAVHIVERTEETVEV